MHGSFCLPSIPLLSHRIGPGEREVVWVLSCSPVSTYNIQEIQNTNHALPLYQPDPKGLKPRLTTWVKPWLNQVNQKGS